MHVSAGVWQLNPEKGLTQSQPGKQVPPEEQEETLHRPTGLSQTQILPLPQSESRKQP
jgi:hypothetical protein